MFPTLNSIIRGTSADREIFTWEEREAAYYEPVIARVSLRCSHLGEEGQIFAGKLLFNNLGYFDADTFLLVLQSVI